MRSLILGYQLPRLAILALLFQRGTSSSKTEDPSICESDSEINFSYCSTAKMISETSKTHLVVLIHGIHGNHNELKYIKEAIEKEAASEILDSSHINFVVHSAKANDGKTLDGIEAGGMRVAEEINSLLLDISEKDTDKDTEIHLTVLGHSLGGLYARHALAHVNWTQPRSSLQEESRKITVVPNVFVTSVTPHLGVQNMTYWNVPAFLEPVGAWGMKRTGSDLFRYTDVLERMCLDEEFLQPLSKFSKRIAYANAFSTDVAVPTETAAFLTQSDHPHSLEYLETYASEEQVEADTNNIYPLARFSVLPNQNTKVERESSSVETYSKALDNLGWTKIFIDVRSQIPGLWRRGEQDNALGQFVFETQALSRNLQDQPTFTSLQLKNGLSTFDWKTLPFGHSFLVASEKNSLYTWFYKGGRPLVDKIAKYLVAEILSTSEN